MKTNSFIKAATRKNTTTENGALSNSSMGSALCDQFATAANYRGRDLADVFADQAAIWEEDGEKALKFIFYLRLISRKVKLNEGFITEKVQNGQGVRDEAFKRLLWVVMNHSDKFYSNIWLLPIVGSWKDLWVIMHYDADFGLNKLDRKIIYELIAQGLKHEEHSELIKKFMPRIKSSGKLTTNWLKNTNKFAKEFATYLGMTPMEYNKFKANGTAHDFQKKICGGMYDSINWSAIPGRALSILTSSKFLENHNLVDSYTSWLMAQPTAKFVGYPYELSKTYLDWVRANWGRKDNMPIHLKCTLDKQFQSLIEQAKSDGTITENVLCALDTSGSMCCQVANGAARALDVCTSLGIYFSELNQGSFHNTVVRFDHTSELIKLSGTFTEKLSQVPMNAMGGTNFQSVIDLMIRVRTENEDIPLEDFPTTILTVSDMQFNMATRRNELTNFEESKSKLYSVFPKEWVDSLKFIWWNVCDRNKDFPTTMDDGGCYIISGFDGSMVNMILGKETTEDKTKPRTPKTQEELINDALSQEILMQISF